MPVTSAEEAWESLGPPWHAAFEEAWASWKAGCFGIGAVLADVDGRIVARGRNRVLEPAHRRAERAIAETLLAHAEMNAFLDYGIDQGTAAGLTMFTTVQPCLMCMATTVTMRVHEVDFATDDRMFDGTVEALSGAPYCVDRMPTMVGPLPGRLAAFALVLPMAFNRAWTPGGRWTRRYAESHPKLMALADDLIASDRLRGASNPAVALVELWDDLAES